MVWIPKYCNFKALIRILPFQITWTTLEFFLGIWWKSWLLSANNTKRRTLVRNWFNQATQDELLSEAAMFYDLLTKNFSSLRSATRPGYMRLSRLTSPSLANSWSGTGPMYMILSRLTSPSLTTSWPGTGPVHVRLSRLTSPSLATSWSGTRPVYVRLSWLGTWTGLELQIRIQCFWVLMLKHTSCKLLVTIDKKCYTTNRSGYYITAKNILDTIQWC